MKSYIKLYSENKKMKKEIKGLEMEIKSLEKDNRLFRKRDEKIFIKGCAHCIHGMPPVLGDYPTPCELLQKNMCSDFVRKEEED